MDHLALSDPIACENIWASRNMKVNQFGLVDKNISQSLVHAFLSLPLHIGNKKWFDGEYIVLAAVL